MRQEGHILWGSGKLSEEDKNMVSNSSSEFKLLIMIFHLFCPLFKNRDAVRSLALKSFSFLHLWQKTTVVQSLIVIEQLQDMLQGTY